MPSSSATQGRAWPGAFPQARVLGLVECGTHAVVAASIAPYAHSEQAMAAKCCRPSSARHAGAGRSELLRLQALDNRLCSGAKLAWRVRSDLKLAIEHPLADGSYLSTVFDSADSHAASAKRCG